MSTARAGWTTDSLTDLADGPAALKELADQIDASIGAVACTSTTRPSAGLYNGFLAYETDTKRLIRYSGSGWVYVTLQVCQGGIGSHAYGGGLGPVSTTVTFPVPFASDPAIALSCNDNRFRVYYGSRTTSGFTLSSKADTTGITLALDVSWVAVGLV